MTELDNLVGATSQPIELSDIVGTPLNAVSYPEAAARNRAATLSMFSETGEESVENFGIMMGENATGDFSYTKQIEDQVASKQEAEDKETFMSILSDPKIPFEQKQALIERLKISPIKTDPSTNLLTTMAQQGSEGETPDVEAARINSVASSINEIYEANQVVQGIVNSHAAGLDSSTGTALLDMIEAWVLPFGPNVTAGTLGETMNPKRSWGERVRSFLDPGRDIINYREKLASLTPDQRIAFTQQLTEAIGSDPDTIFASKNQFAEYEKLLQIFEEDGYDNTDLWIDRVATVLDIAGLGFLFRQPRKAIKAANTPRAATPARTPGMPPVASSKAVPEAPSAAPAPVTKDYYYNIRNRTEEEIVQDVGAFNNATIQRLEKDRARLLAEQGGALEKGEVSRIEGEIGALEAKIVEVTPEMVKELQASKKLTSKEAKKEAAKIVKDQNADVEASIARLSNQLEGNRTAAKAAQKISQLDEEIAVLKSNKLFPSKKTAIADLVSRIEVNGIVRRENPASPLGTAKQANPQKAREMHSTILESMNDEVSKAMAGAKADETIADGVLPQFTNESNRIVNKPVDIERMTRIKALVPDKIKDLIWSAGRMDITPAEKAAAKANIVRRFDMAENMRMESSMSSFAIDGGRIKISAMYGTPEGAFNNAKDAVEQAAYSFRQYGIGKDDFEVMVRDGRDFRPATEADMAQEGSFMVRVNTYHEIDPTDVVGVDGTGAFESFAVKRNFFDRLSGTMSAARGSLSRHIADVASMLDSRLVGAASTGVDRGARLEQYMLDLATVYSDKFAALNKVEKAEVDKYLMEANFQGIQFDVTDLIARGFSTPQISAVSSWRSFWDAQFYLENMDIVRTLRAQGFEKITTQHADLFARRMAKNYGNNRVYDPTTDSIKVLDQAAMDLLYTNGGTIAKLRRPTDFGGEVLEHIVVENNGVSFLRRLRDTDMALNYRPGYYNIQYKAPRFVDEITVDAAGKEIRKAVAVAGDTAEATRFANRMSASSSTGARYEVRADDRAMRSGSDDWFDVNSAGGRIAQRHRGKLLEDGSGMNHLGDGSYVLDPVTSAVRAAKSISGRTVMRPVLETAKARFLQQYEKFLPSDGMGGKRFPSDVGEIGGKGMQFTKEVADARTTYEYIRYLENGYINEVDDVFKALMHTFSGSFGKTTTKLGIRGAGKVERGIEHLSNAAPSQAGKNFVFHAFLGTHPLRQFIIQPHQAVRTAFYNPIGAASGSYTRLSAAYMARKLGEKLNYKWFSQADINDFVDFIDSSGVMSAVDKQNLVRGTLSDAADKSNKLIKLGIGALNVPRKIGFDNGERLNMLGHMSAVYDKYKRSGKNLSDKAVREEMHAEARALSYGMNFATDMPYNQNAAGLVLQFMQVPHKAFLQVTNRQLSRSDRAKLLAGDLLFWGGPTVLVSELLGGDILPDDPGMREFFVNGIEGMLLNEMFRNFAKDDDINIDFSSLAPYDMTGWSEFFKGVLEDGLIGVISNSPAYQLFISDESKTQKAIHNTLRFFSMQEQIEESPEQFMDVLKEWASISSGFSTGMKAWMALKTGERYDKYGQVIDPETNKLEAVMEAFGFTDRSRADMFALSKSVSQDLKTHKEDVTKDVKFILDHINKRLEGAEPREVETIRRAAAFALSKYADDPEGQEVFHQVLGLYLRDPDNSLLTRVMKASDIPTGEGMKDKIRMSNLPEEEKQLLLERIDDVTNIRKGN